MNWFKKLLGPFFNEGQRMSVKRLAVTYAEFRKRALWTLLASDTAPKTIAILQSLLFEESQGLPASIFLERLENYLNQLSTETIERPQVIMFANKLRTDGYVVIRYGDEHPEPVYSLTTAAYEAIRFVTSQMGTRVAPTESRLEMVIHSAKKIADETSLDVDRRVQWLEREKVKIQEKIKALQNGEMLQLDDVDIKVRMSDLNEMLLRLNEDFLRLHDRFRELADHLHESIMRNEGSAQTMLDSFFMGYDRISDSEEGRLFKAFYEFLSNPVVMAEWEEAIDSLQDREFWTRLLTSKEQSDLINLRKNLTLRVRETQGLMKKLASSLKHLVQSREYLENRRLMQMIDEARRLAIAVKDEMTPLATICQIDQTSVRISSSSTLNLYDPVSDALPETLDDVVIEQDIDLEGLATRLSLAEINYTWLRDCVEVVLGAQPRASVADVLFHFPASQGLASVVGLMKLALNYGYRLNDQTERVTWETRLGQRRSATIPMLIFDENSLQNLKEKE